MKVNPKSKWFSGVDSIRFLLALMVVLSHLNNVYAITLKHSSYWLLNDAGYFLANAFDGTSAVIAFFIISGFVIHYPNKRGIKNLTAFWLRRYMRIIIPLAAIIIIGAWFNHPEKKVIWSLVCELIYYTIYPLLLSIGLSWKSKLYIAYFIAALTVCFLEMDNIRSFLHLKQNHPDIHWHLAPYITWLMWLPCWLLGVLIAEHIDNLNRVTLKKVIICRLSVFMLSVICSYSHFHLHINYIFSMNVFALVLYMWLQAEIIYFKSRPANQTLEKMGKFSYSLYLCHPVIYLILNLYIVNTVYTYPIFVILTISLSYGFYLFIEKPAHIFARKINSRYNPVLN